jgi:hypothetical protein
VTLRTPFEELNGSFVLLRRRTGLEGPEVAPLASLRVPPLRVKAESAVLQLPDHRDDLEAILPRDM